MQTIKVKTSQNITIDYEIGGLGERIIALLIDYVIFIPFLFLGALVAFLGPNIAIYIYYVILSVIFVFYNLLCESFFNGQSLGKRVMKIRVISLDGGRPKFSQYLLRWLFRFIDFAISGGIVALVSAIVTDKGQRVGDLVADTVMIRTEPRANHNNIIYQPVDEAYIPAYEQVTQLSDKDIGLIHDVVNVYYRTGDIAIVVTMAGKVRERLSIAASQTPNDLDFLNTITKDFTHITAQANVL